MIWIFQVVLSAAGRCHSKMGNWEAALGSAEFVLSKDPKNPGAILIKAEALFNLCNFEHALMHFYRGQVMVPFFHWEFLSEKKIAARLNCFFPYFEYYCIFFFYFFFISEILIKVKPLSEYMSPINANKNTAHLHNNNKFINFQKYQQTLNLQFQW